jgi:hypothetical protein
MDMAIIKHTAWPATGEEILRAVGVTEEDRKAVDRMLKKLGYASDSPGGSRRAAAPSAKATAAAKAPAKKTATRTKPAKAKKAVTRTPAGASSKKSVPRKTSK